MANGFQVSGDPVPAGEDASAAPLEQASPEAAAAEEPRAPAKDGHVTLATVPPLGSVTVDDIVITEAGTEVDAATAERARAAAQAGGFTLREI